MKSLCILSLILIISVLGLAACSTQAPAETANILGVTVSILPEKYFVERIGGNLVSVNVMVGPGDSPHTYEPKPEQMAALSRASIYFRIGVEFENAWMERIASTNPKMKIVDLSADVNKIPMTVSENGKPPQGEPDPHIWTSPALVKLMAERIYEELSTLDPANSSIYKSNLDSFNKDIDLLDKDIHKALDELKNRNFMVFHPGWAYFARDYNLKEIAIEFGGTEPSASELAALIDTAKADNIQVVFAQPEFSTQIASYIAKEISGEVVLISPLAENWLENLRQVAETFKKNL